MVEENVVTEPESTPDTGAPEVTPEPAAEPTPDKGENRIPISRAEEMWQRREAKARADWEEKHLKPLQTKQAEYEKVLSKIAAGQIEFGRQLGVIPPEKPDYGGVGTSGLEVPKVCGEQEIPGCRAS